MKFLKKICWKLLLGLFVLCHPPNANADLKVGEQAILFDSVDENLNPVSMTDMTDGKPLVLVVSSCS